MPHLALRFYGVLATEQFIDGDLVNQQPGLARSCRVYGTAGDAGGARERKDLGLRSLAQRGAKEKEPIRLFGFWGRCNLAFSLLQTGHVAAERAIEAQVCLRSYPIYYR